MAFAATCSEGRASLDHSTSERLLVKRLLLG
jgi:hypothetical protein